MSRYINLQKEDSARSLPELLRKENTEINENNFCTYSSQSTDSSSSSSETVISASYLPIYERRKTAEHATLYAKQAQERSHHELNFFKK